MAVRNRQQLRAIFSRLGGIKPVRRIAIAGAVVGGVYGLHKVRKIYKEHQMTKNRQAIRERLRKTLENEKIRKVRVAQLRKQDLAYTRKLTAKERKQVDETIRKNVREDLLKRFPTRDALLKEQHPHLFNDPVIPKTADSDSQQAVRTVALAQGSEKYLKEPDEIEKEFKVRRVRPRIEHTQDVVSRMQGRRRRRYDY
jgi:hypothetical protein